mmetsp:Transcript_218/g.500  ORF Transcript_218/g.500 Transcript_218/m.500 type:complete len:336 (+) Transcript_218:363-1370(+)
MAGWRRCPCCPRPRSGRPPGPATAAAASRWGRRLWARAGDHAWRSPHPSCWLHRTGWWGLLRALAHPPVSAPVRTATRRSAHPARHSSAALAGAHWGARRRPGMPGRAPRHTRLWVRGAACWTAWGCCHPGVAPWCPPWRARPPPACLHPATPPCAGCPAQGRTPWRARHTAASAPWHRRLMALPCHRRACYMTACTPPSHPWTLCHWWRPARWLPRAWPAVRRRAAAGWAARAAACCGRRCGCGSATRGLGGRHPGRTGRARQAAARARARSWHRYPAASQRPTSPHCLSAAAYPSCRCWPPNKRQTSALCHVPHRARLTHRWGLHHRQCPCPP